MSPVNQTEQKRLTTVWRNTEHLCIILHWSQLL